MSDNDDDVYKRRYCPICGDLMEFDEDDERFYCSNLNCGDEE